MTLSTVHLIIQLQCLEIIALITISVQEKNRNLSDEIQESEKYQTIISNLSKELHTLRQQQAVSGPANETMNTKVVSESELDTDNIQPRIKRSRKRKILNQTSGSDSDSNTKKSDTTYDKPRKAMEINTKGCSTTTRPQKNE